MSHCYRRYLVEAAHFILGTGDDALLLLLHEGDHPDDVLLADVAVLAGHLHQPVAGLVEETLRRLPVLGGRRVEEVVEAVLVLLALPPALGVALHEEVHVDHVPVLHGALVRRGDDRGRVNILDKNDFEQKEKYTRPVHLLSVKF